MSGLAAGAAYEIVTVAVEATREGNVRVIFDPLMLVLVGINVAALAPTVNVFAGAVVERRASLNVSTNVVPFDFSSPDVKAGRTVSVIAARNSG